jgi:hypothetical protein
MNFVPIVFIVMDMRSNTSTPIILGRPFLRTMGAVIDSKEVNVKFQFPHKKCMENFTRKKVNRDTSALMTLALLEAIR